jgi:hypothetical protein
MSAYRTSGVQPSIVFTYPDTLDAGYPTSYDEGLRRLDDLRWRYEFPADFIEHLDSVLDQSMHSPDRAMAVTRVDALAAYLNAVHPEYADVESACIALEDVADTLRGRRD